MRHPEASLVSRQPGADAPPGATVGGLTNAVLAGRTTRGEGRPATNLVGGWPGFRGPNLSGISPTTVKLARAWGRTGPRVLWGVEVGEGYAGPAIRNGSVYLMDYDREKRQDALRCLSLADGREVWRFAYPVSVKRNHGMSRTVPAVTERSVVTIGPKCHVACVDAGSGELRWGLDMVRQFGATVPQWYAGQCPLIDGDKVILAPSGDCLMMAVDLATGKILWRSPNPRAWKMTHTSITPMEFDGKRMYLYSASDGVAGVAAADGQTLFESDIWTVPNAACASPVVVGTDRIFFSGGYGAGCLMAQLKLVDGKITMNPLWRLKPTEFGSTQHTPILYRDHLYGIRPDGQFACLDLNGKIVWKSGAADRFGALGRSPYLLANGLYYILSEEGRLVLAEATSSGYRQLSAAQILGHETDGPLVMAAGRLFCRDLTTLVCLDATGGKR